MPASSRGPSGSYDPAGYLQNRVAMHPSVIAGAMPAPLIGEPLGGCRLQSLPCKGRCRRRRRRGAAPCHAFTLTGQQCPHRPANLSAVAMLPGGRNRLPGKASGGRDEKHLSAARPVFLAPVPGLGTCSRQIVGRAFTPAAKASGCRGVSGPMLGIVPQSCRSPQCLGAHSFFSAAFRLSPGCPAGEIARPTMQGKRQAKPETLPLRLTFLFPAPICGGL